MMGWKRPIFLGIFTYRKAGLIKNNASHDDVSGEYSPITVVLFFNFSNNQKTPEIYQSAFDKIHLYSR